MEKISSIKKYLKKGLTGIAFYMYIKNINDKDKI